MLKPAQALGPQSSEAIRQTAVGRAWQSRDPLFVFGSATQGLEVSGVALANAGNRGQPAPAIRTSPPK
jgi:hypothetical protein